ncbi:MAG: hypothetical protein LBL83_10735, partial [Clostridiales bacterium]|nr:hypothetical protein [Clostridiales bacterium]
MKKHMTNTKLGAMLLAALLFCAGCAAPQAAMGTSETTAPLPPATEAPGGGAASAAPSAQESAESGQGSPTSQNDGQGGQSAQNGQPQQPQQAPVTLTAFIDSPNALEGWQWGDDAVSREITRRTGVTLDITNASTADHQELSTALAAGDAIADFIIAHPYGPMPHMLISQGFAAPLNKLADEFCPEFWDALPTDEDTILNWDDGNLYYVVDEFGDAERIGEIKEPHGSLVVFMANLEMWEELGKPEMATLEQVREALARAKGQLGTAFPIYDGK